MKKIAILLIAFATVGFTAQAQQERILNGNSKDDRNTRVFVHRSGSSDNMIPNLSQEQKDEIKKLRLEMTKETTSLRNQMAEKRARLNTLQSADKADMSAINKTIDEISVLQAQQMKAKANFHVKVRSLLNDEQKIAFDSRKHGNFSFGNGMGQMRMRSLGFDGSNLKAPGHWDKIGRLDEIDFDPSLEHHFELEIED